MSEIQCKEVIISKLTGRGNGTIQSPIRIVTEVYEKDGTLIAELDLSPEIFTAMDLIDFSRWVKEKGWDADKLDGNVVSKWLDELNK